MSQYGGMGLIRALGLSLPRHIVNDQHLVEEGLEGLGESLVLGVRQVGVARLRHVERDQKALREALGQPCHPLD